MRDIWKYIKTFFSLKKILNKEGMSIESIQKIYVMLGALIVGINADWIPGLVYDAVSPAATNLIFTAVGAVVAVFQFFKARTGKDKPLELRSEKGGSASLAYIIWPFKKA